MIGSGAPVRPRDPGGVRYAAARRRRLLRHAAAWAAGGRPRLGPVVAREARSQRRISMRSRAKSVRFERAYPEALPTLCARRTIYTGRRTYPFHNGDFRHIKGDFVGIAPGWGPIPESQATLAEMYEAGGFRTGLVSDLYHEFKPSKNFWRGFHQWTFIRGQEPTPRAADPFLAGGDRLLGAARAPGAARQGDGARAAGLRRALVLEPHPAQHARPRARGAVVQRPGHAGAARWLEQNLDAERFFLTVESFDPHEPWFVPEHYRRRTTPADGPRAGASRRYAEMP